MGTTSVFTPEPASTKPWWADGQIVLDNNTGKWWRYDAELNTLSPCVMHEPVPDDGEPLPSIDPFSAASAHPVIPTAKVIPLPVSAANAAPPVTAVYIEHPPVTTDPELADELVREYDNLAAGLGHHPQFDSIWRDTARALIHAHAQVKAQAIPGIRTKR
jgi:hypothetical protein